MVKVWLFDGRIFTCTVKEFLHLMNAGRVRYYEDNDYYPELEK